MTYRPLPKELTIAKSKIEGLGLFASKDIKKGVILGISHVRDNRFENGFIRTPLGGFYQSFRSSKFRDNFHKRRQICENN